MTNVGFIITSKYLVHILLLNHSLLFGSSEIHNYE